MIVASKLHKGQERRDLWKERCVALADEIHHEAAELHAWWEQLWMCRVAELGWPRGLAKWQALRDTRESLDRRGTVSN